ncbi:hypothetical protein OG458_10400 [Streptomyces sp. NBC_01281]|uniref:hypothetical protein n=1 Tax=Streptomyces sp. NBC_01281 TaxID=2903811 RepID=UPI002E109420|nr:hypothetical protein OG458_10400 [Streptomyces sp. NBC_01281]
MNPTGTGAARSGTAADRVAAHAHDRHTNDHRPDGHPTNSRRPDGHAANGRRTSGSHPHDQHDQHDQQDPHEDQHQEREQYA